MTMVTKERPPLRLRKKEATRERIIQTAIKIFGKRGLAAPTVEEIAAAADVGKGTIYNYFATKEEIVVAFMVELEEHVQAKTADFSRARGPADRILADFIRFQLRLKEPYRDFVRVFMAQLYTRGSALGPYFDALQEHINPPLVELFSSLMARRMVRPGVNLASLIEIFKLLQIGIITLWINEEPPYAGAMLLLDEEMRLFCSGLAEKTDAQTSQPQL